jgi:cytochrome c-type biogenesis protein CcmE
VTAVDPRPRGAWRKVAIAMEGVDPDLVRAVREGTYVVDPRLVADAILRRHSERREAPRLAGVLEALERDGGSVAGAQDDSGSVADGA